jgi:hypothetical protein
LLYDTGTYVGLGTTAPSYELEIAGDVLLSGSLQVGSILSNTGTDTVLVTDINGILQQRDINSRVWGDTLVDGTGPGANYLTKWLDGDTVTFSNIYDTGTNIGIGTTNPGYDLEIVGSVNTDTLFINDQAVTADATEINYLDGATALDGGIVVGDGTGFTQEVESLFWDIVDNYLGIGNSDPTTWAHVGYGDDPAQFVAGSAESVYIEGNLEVRGTIFGATSGPVTTTGFEPYGVMYASDVGAITNNNERIYFDYVNNRLGIGLSAPTYNLEVIGDAYIDEGITAASFTDGTLLLTGGQGTGFTYLQVDNIEIDGNTLSSSSGDLYFMPASGQQVGIGTSTPAYDFDVVGDTRISGSLQLGTISSNTGTDTVLVNAG